MRFAFPFGISAVALCIAISPAAADPDGFISAGIGGSNLTENDDNFGSPLVQGRGSVSIGLTPELSVQGDVVLQYQRYEFQPESIYNLDGALHFSYRDPQQFLLGGIVQFGNQTGGPEIGTLSRVFAGLEAQAYLGDATLYGQVGLAKASFFDDLHTSGLFATGELRYFLTPDFKIDVHGSAVSLTWDDDDVLKTATYGVGVGAEYRLADSPISIFGSLDYFQLRPSYNNVTQSLDNARVLVGMKFNFGSETLQDRDRNGATLNPISQAILFPPAIP